MNMKNKRTIKASVYIILLFTYTIYFKGSFPQSPRFRLYIVHLFSTTKTEPYLENRLSNAVER
jgi:hypothetical protein